jgi:hypothetical protein
MPWTMAQSFGAQVSAIAFEMNIQLPIGLYADPLGVSGILAADREKTIGSNIAVHIGCLVDLACNDSS